MEGEQRRESAVDLALHVGEVRGRQQAIEEKQRDIDQWRNAADERLKQQDERLKNLPAEVARAIDEIPPDDQTPPLSQRRTSDESHINESTENGSIADQRKPTSSDGKDDGRRVAPPPAVPNPNDRAPNSTDQQTSSDAQQQHDNQAPPPAPRRSVTHRFR